MRKKPVEFSVFGCLEHGQLPEITSEGRVLCRSRERECMRARSLYDWNSKVRRHLIETEEKAIVTGNNPPLVNPDVEALRSRVETLEERLREVEEKISAFRVRGKMPAGLEGVTLSSQTGLRKFEVWSEGEPGEATIAYHGEVVAQSFEEACEKLFGYREDFDRENLTLWGLKLHETKDAAMGGHCCG